jgi:hypothetical protein
MSSEAKLYLRGVGSRNQRLDGALGCSGSESWTLGELAPPLMHNEAAWDEVMILNLTSKVFSPQELHPLVAIGCRAGSADVGRGVSA